MFKKLFIAAAALWTLGVFSTPAQANERQSEAEYKYVRVNQTPSRETWAWVRKTERAERPYALTGERSAREPRTTWVWAGPHRVGIHMLRPDRD